MARQRQEDSASESTALWIDEYVRRQFAKADPTISSPRLVERFDARSPESAGADQSFENVCESSSGE